MSIINKENKTIKHSAMVILETSENGYFQVSTLLDDDELFLNQEFFTIYEAIDYIKSIIHCLTGIRKPIASFNHKKETCIFHFEHDITCDIDDCDISNHYICSEFFFFVKH